MCNPDSHQFFPREHHPRLQNANHPLVPLGAPLARTDRLRLNSLEPQTLTSPQLSRGPALRIWTTWVPAGGSSPPFVTGGGTRPHASRLVGGAGTESWTKQCYSAVGYSGPYYLIFHSVERGFLVSGPSLERYLSLWGTDYLRGVVPRKPDINQAPSRRLPRHFPRLHQERSSPKTEEHWHQLLSRTLAPWLFLGTQISHPSLFSAPLFPLHTKTLPSLGHCVPVLLD